ncbi:MAG: phage tail protein I [Pseudomonadota bacterium]
MTSILPPNSTPQEKALDGVMARVGAVPVDLRSLWRPQEVDAKLLPWLAWALSLDIWDDEWPERVKRAAVAESYALHRERGTLSGLRRVARLGGAELVDAEVPPGKVFVAPAWSEADRAEWLRQFDELRIFARRSRGTAVGAMLPAQSPAARKLFIGGSAGSGVFPNTSDAVRRTNPRAFVVRPDGSEEELPASAIDPGADFIDQVNRQGGAIGATLRLTRRSPRGTGAILGASSFIGSASATPLDRGAARRTYTASVNDTVSGERTGQWAIYPGTRLVSAQAERVAESGTQKGAMLGSTFLGPFLRRVEAPSYDPPWLAEGVPWDDGAQWRDRAFWVDDASDGLVLARPTAFTVDHYADERLYRRTHLYRPGQGGRGRGSSAHLGAMRLGVPAHEAIIRLRARGRRSRQQAGAFVSGFLMRSENRALRTTLEAMRWAKSARDRVHVTTKTHAPVTAGGSIYAGQVTCGEWRAI